LPKKNWHVRTWKNIQRVKRDQKKVAEEEKAKRERGELAEQEARTSYLKQKAVQRREDEGVVPSTSSSNGTEPLQHINFFAELEAQERTFGVNKDHEVDKKQEREAWEKKLGVLKYLGEGSAEASSEKPWYEKLPDRLVAKSKRPEEASVSVLKKIEPQEKPNEVKSSIASAQKMKKIEPQEKPNEVKSSIASAQKKKSSRRKEKKHKRHRKHKRSRSSSSSSEWTSNAEDETIEEKSKSRKRKKKNTHKKKSKRRRSASSDSSDKSDEIQIIKVEEKIKNGAEIEKLRAERLRREQMERTRAEQLLKKVQNGGIMPEEKPKDPLFVPKYSSQFNPELCRQNRVPAS